MLKPRNTKSMCVASLRIITPPRDGQPKMETLVSVNWTRRVESVVGLRGPQLGPFFGAELRREAGVRMIEWKLTDDRARRSQWDGTPTQRRVNFSVKVKFRG